MSRHDLRRYLPLWLLFDLAFSCLLANAGQMPVHAQPGPGSVSPGTSPPRLILLLVIDQARGDYLDRFRPLLSGGLARLLDDGIYYTQAYYGHALTLTAPGHATLATGLHPSHHGIISNQWFDREKQEDAYCVGDPVHVRSPRNLLGSTLGDWLKKSDPASRVYSVSGKDRAAILLGGHEADAAIWYDRLTGHFITSSYYGNNNPPWLAAFNDRKIPDQSFAAPWEPLPVETDLSPFGIVTPDLGAYTTGFPRALGGTSSIPGAAYYSDYYASPAADEYLASLAKEIIQRERLGKDDHPDLLALSFSSLDAVGHRYGPDSREVLDTLLRLDRVLGELLSFLDREVGSHRILVALSSDHGILSLPELKTGPHEESRRFTTTDMLCHQGAALRLRAQLGDGDWLLDDFYLNPETIAARGLDRDQVALQLARIYEDCPAVQRAWTAATMEAKANRQDPFSRMFANSYQPRRSPDLLLQMKPGILPFARPGTSHGSPYPYDTHVPFLMVVPGYGPGRVANKVQIVDIAPTVAALAGIAVPAGLDGQSQAGAMQSFRDRPADIETEVPRNPPPR